MSDTKSKKRVGVIRGGEREHYASSIKRGGEVILNIVDNLGDKYKVVDILIDKDYIWHVNGVPTNPGDLVYKVDIVWNTSHPSFSNILDSLSIPNISVSTFSSVLSSSREMLRKHMQGIGVDMPRSIVLPFYQEDFDGPRDKYAVKKAKEVFEKFGSPWIVKSFTPDANMAIHLAKTFPELVNAIEDGVNHGKSILVEEFITGKVASVHSVPGFRKDLPAPRLRGQEAGELYVFPIDSTHGNFSSSEKDKLSKYTKDLHKHIGAKHYLRTDFVMTPRGKVYLLSIDSTPDLRSDSHFSKICESVGAKVHHVVDHILEQAL